MRIIITVIYFTIVLNGFAQRLFDPKVIVLMPLEVEIENGLNEQIDFYEKYAIEYQKLYLIAKKDSLLKLISENDSIALNDKVFYKQKIESAHNLNIQNKILQDYAASFQNILGMDFKLPLVLVDTTKSFSDPNLMQKFSEATDADYLINTLSLSITRFDSDIMIKPKFTIYNRSENRIIDIAPLDYNEYNKTHITADQRTLNIYFDDLDAMSKILRYIKENGESDQRNLEKSRNNILQNSFNQGKKSFWLKEKIRTSNISIDYDSYVSGIVNSDSTKFLAFFISEGSPFGDDLSQWHKISILYGKKQDGLWSYEFIRKDMYIRKELSKAEQINKTFMMTKNIFYFKENSEELNSNFWNKELFIEYKVRYFM